MRCRNAVWKLHKTDYNYWGFICPQPPASGPEAAGQLFPAICKQSHLQVKRGCHEAAFANEGMIFVKGLTVRTIALDVDLLQDLASLRTAIQVLSCFCKLCLCQRFTRLLCVE